MEVNDAWYERMGHRSLLAGDPDADDVAAAQRDPAQFAVLYDRYMVPIHRYVRVRIGDAAQAEDVTSQIFLSALAHLDTFRSGGRFAAWLFRIAQHAVTDSYRERRPDPVSDEVVAMLIDATLSPEEFALTRERAAQARALVATLRPDQQHLLALRYGAELSFAEMAQILDRNVVAVRVGVHRALKELRGRYHHAGSR